MAQAQLCFSLALWNEKDPIVKERLFGLNSREGNHGEDVKELYLYLDYTAHPLVHEIPLQISPMPIPYYDLVKREPERVHRYRIRNPGYPRV